jgi:uncharacterized protein YecT (DUF1311 family)
MRLAAVVLLLSMLPVTSLAQETDCAAAQTQAEMNACAYQDWEAADAVLNALWPQARAVTKAQDADLPEELKGADQALLNAQRAWIAFRDAQCASEGFAMRGGSAEPLLIYGCMASLTEDRVEDLRAVIEGY